MGRASAKKAALRAEKSGSSEHQHVPPPGPPPAGQLLRWVSIATLGSAGLAFFMVGELPYPMVFRAALTLAFVGATVGLVAAKSTRRNPKSLGLTFAALAGALGLLYARQQGSLTPLFGATHSHLVSIPSELPPLVLAAACLSRTLGCRGPAIGLAQTLGTLGLLGSLFGPAYWLTELQIPLILALDSIGSASGDSRAWFVIFMAFPAVAGCLGLMRPWPHSHAVHWMGCLGLPLVVLHTIVSAGGSETPLPLALSMAALAISVCCALFVVLSAWLQAMEQQLKPGQWCDPTLDRVAAAAVIVVYLLLKTHGMGPSNTDENIYFYMAHALSDGLLPYRDYFFAHPPLHILVPGAFIWLLDLDNVLTLKWFSALAGAVTGLLTWAIAKQHFGRMPALIALVAFLFAAETLKASTNMTGINLTLMWLMLALWASMRGRATLGGVSLAIAVCTGFYAMGAVCAIVLIGAFRDRRFAIIQLATFLLVAGAINLTFWLIAGDAYLEGVYTYHGLKPLRESEMLPLWGPGSGALLSSWWHNLGVMVDAKPFTKDVYYHSHLWLGGILVPVFAAISWLLRGPSRGPWWSFFDPRRLWRDDDEGAAALVCLVTIALFIQFALFRELYSFYFTLIYPCLSLCLAWSMWRAVRWLLDGIDLAGVARSGRALLGVLACAATLLWVPWAAEANRVFPSEIRDLGKHNPYTWVPAPTWTPASGFTKALFWEDHRLKGNMSRGYLHYLWTKKRALSTADEVASWIKKHSQPDDTIAGASGITPLLALLSERRLAANEADTNSKRFRAGRLIRQEAPERWVTDTRRLVDDEAYWTAICNDKVRFLISTQRSYFSRRKLSSLPIAKRWFKPVKTFWDPTVNYNRKFAITIYERVGPSEARCSWSGPPP